MIREARQEDFSAIRDFLVESCHLYPTIEAWWQSKVLPETSTGRRVVLVAEQDGSIGGVFIGKRGRFAKLCTLRLREDLRGKGTGRILAAQGLALLLDTHTVEVHVTVSESGDPGTSSFFEGLGFTENAIQRNRYVAGVDEFVYSADPRRLSALSAKIVSAETVPCPLGVRQRPKGGIHGGNALLMSIKPEFAALFLSGKKQIEFRRAFSRKHVGSRIVFYASAPERRFFLQGAIADVVKAGVRPLWTTYGTASGIEKSVFDDYFRGRHTGYAISFVRLRPLRRPVPLHEIRRRWPGFHPPQSFQTIEPESPVLEMLGR